MTHSSIATDKQIEYLHSLHKKHSLPIPAEVEGGTITKADASALIEALKSCSPPKSVTAPPPKSQPSGGSYQDRLYRMLIEIEEELLKGRAESVAAIKRIDAALDRMAPTIKALHERVKTKDDVEYEQFLDDNKPELNYDVKADVYDEPGNFSTDNCPF